MAAGTGWRINDISLLPVLPVAYLPWSSAIAHTLAAANAPARARRVGLTELLARLPTRRGAAPASTELISHPSYCRLALAALPTAGAPESRRRPAVEYAGHGAR